MEYLWLTLAWTGWCVLHSALISRRLREKAAAVWPPLDRYWRLIYTLIALATFLPPAYLTHRIVGPWLIVWPAKWPLLVINLAAVALGWTAIRAHGGAAVFLGTASLSDPDPPQRPQRPIQTGLLGWVRHPLYGLAIVLLWAHDLRAASFIATIILTAYLLVGTVVEEWRLAKEWGPDWLEYRSQVSAFFPFKRLKSVFKSTR